MIRIKTVCDFLLPFKKCGKELFVNFISGENVLGAIFHQRLKVCNDLFRRTFYKNLPIVLLNRHRAGTMQTMHVFQVVQAAQMSPFKVLQGN